MQLCYLLIHILESLSELRCYLLLVSYAEIFEVEWLRMSGLSSHPAPFSCCISIGPFDEVERILHPLVHLAHRDNILCLVLHAPSAVCSLAADTAGEDRHGLHVHILAELEVLIVSESHRLVVAPCVLQLPALMLWSDGCLPAVGVPESVSATVDDTSSGESHELRVERLKGLSEVTAHAMTLVCVLWHEREGVDIHHTRGEGKEEERRVGARCGGCQCASVSLPCLAVYCQRGVSDNLALGAWLDESHTDLLCLPVDVAGEEREVVSRAFLDSDSVESVVLESESAPAVIVIILLGALYVQAHVVEVVRVQGVGLECLYQTERVAWALHTPSC